MRGLRCDSHTVELEVLPFEIEALLAPGKPADLHQFLGAADPLAHGNVEHPELFLAPAKRQPYRQPATRDLVDHGAVLGKTKGLLEGSEDNTVAQADLLRDRGDRGEHQVQRGKIAVGRTVMFGYPRRVEAGVLVHV